MGDESTAAQTTRSLERVAILRKLLLLGSLFQWRDLLALMKKHFALTARLSPGRNFRTDSLLFTVLVMRNYMIARAATWNFFGQAFFPRPEGADGNLIDLFPHSTFMLSLIHPQNNVEANAFWQNFSKPLSSSRHHQHQNNSLVVLLMNLCASTNSD